MFPSILEERLSKYERASLKRRLSSPAGIDFTSNDYLGFASDAVFLRSRFTEALDGLPLSASASRLLRGHLPLFDEVEKTLAGFSGQEAALLFPSGYQANVGLYSAILNQHATVFSDALNHASIVDGIRLSRAHKVVYPHVDMFALRRALEAASGSAGLKVIASESVFSMDGDLAPLGELVSLAEEFGALLVIDEAHATGVFGAGLVKHQGLCHRVFATTHTGGKALGASGAWVAGSARLREYLVQFSRALIYSTAPAPAQAMLLKQSVEYWAEVGEVRAQALLSRFEGLRKELQPLSRIPGVRIPEVHGPILPVILGNTERALKAAEKLQKEGFDVRAIRPPTVPIGGDRLRVILHWQNSPTEIQAFAKALGSALESEWS